MKLREKPVDVIDDNGIRSKVDLIGLFFKIFCGLVILAMIVITVISSLLPLMLKGTSRIVTMFSSLVGMAVIALLTGIITAAYMDEIRRNKTKGKLTL